MKRVVLLSAVFLFSLWTLFSGPQTQEKQIEEDRTRAAGQAAISVSVEQIRVDVTVRDKDGNLISGLEKEHFTVYEDKVQQEITYFEPVDGPMTKTRTLTIACGNSASRSSWNCGARLGMVFESSTSRGRMRSGLA